MRALPLLLLTVLAACSVKADDEDSKASVSIDGVVKVDADDDKASVVAGGSRGLKIDTDGFKAAIDIPGMSIGGKDFDIDGMKLYPGSTVKGMAIKANDAGGDKSGTVTVTFTSPATPDAVLVHAEAQAKDENYTVKRSGLTLTGSKDADHRFVYTVAAAGAGTSGTMVMTDTKHK